MGLCLSCFGSYTPGNTDEADEGHQQQEESSVDNQPIISPERPVSKSARRRNRRRLAKLEQAQSQPTESTPLLDDTVDESNSQVSSGTVPNHPVIPSELSSRSSDIVLEQLLQNAKQMAASDRKEHLWLRKHWHTVISSLSIKKPMPSAGFKSEYLDVSTLREMYNPQSPERIIQHLCALARGRENLKTLTDQYVYPLLYFSVALIESHLTRMNEYSPLSMTVGQPIFVHLDFLKSGGYYVRDFFTALHVILLSLLPPQKDLREYLQIFLLLQKLLYRALEKYRREYKGKHFLQIPTKMSLLVFIPSERPQQSLRVPRCIIGFSGVGVRNRTIEERHVNLPVLQSVTRKHPLGWPVGNCGEAETLAYTYRIPNGKAVDNFRILLVQLTLNLREPVPKPEPMCDQCKETLSCIRKQYPVLVTLDLAPKGKRNHELEISGPSQV